MTTSATVELLAPAGDRRALRAALAAGADAVYFGLERWSARAFAGNFAAEHAVEAIELAHLYDARAHLALNTLLKDAEVEPALAALEAPYAAGLDALIVADLGFAARVREEYPHLPLHASTQLDTHSSAQLAALSRLGFARAILARELSLAEIGGLEPHGLELEAFVHGALCYGYSGDCLLSSMIGGRSGNRGRCSQSCRMRYGLRRADTGAATAPPAAAGPSAAPAAAAPSVTAGPSRAPAAGPSRAPAAGSRGATAAGGPAGATAAAAATRPPAVRVLSTADLCAVGALPALLGAGVTSFKIEGRMKDAAYVAVTTAVYREALDAALRDPEGYAVRPQWLERLEQAFSRGFTSAHLEGRPNDVRSGGRGGHRGVLVGRVEQAGRSEGEVVVRLTRPVAAGDVLSIYTPWGQSEPVRVEADTADRLTLRLRERVAAKDRVFRVAGADIGALARDLVAGRVVNRPVEVAARLEGRAGEPARLTLHALPEGPEVTAASDERLAPARHAALDAARVRAALAALGGTPYRLAALDVELGEGLFLPVAELKGLRRRTVAALDRARLGARRRPAGRRAATPAAAVPTALTAFATRPAAVIASDTPSAAAAGAATPPAATPPAATPPAATPPAAAAGAASPATGARLGSAAPDLQVVLVVRPGEVPEVAPGVTAVCLDLEVGDEPAEVKSAVARLAALGSPPRCRPPEVLFDADLAWWREVAGAGWSAVYVRHLGLVRELPPGVAAVLEYPLQGLGSGTVTILRHLARDPVETEPRETTGAPTPRSGRPRAEGALRAHGAHTPWTVPAGVVASPEASLEEIARLAADLALLRPPATVEALAFGRQQVLRTRDQLGRAEGLYATPGPRDHVALLLRDAKGYVFPAAADRAGTRIFNARVTNLAAHLDELVAAGVSACLVVQADMDDDERRAFRAGGLAALAPFATRDRATTGHLYRGVA